MPNGIEQQPLNEIHWIDRERLHANNYNPNHVAPRERQLLKISILEDGWTQPIVARSDGEIVDGFHRWMTSADPEVAAMTNSKVPVVFLEVKRMHQMMSTIRHNRARGSHAVLKMADIVRYLIEEDGLSFAEVGHRLQMEEEEVDRLYDRSGMIVRGAREGFHSGWVPSEEA